MSILSLIELAIVIGDPKSSNSNSLKEIVETQGKIPAYLVHEESEICDVWLEGKKVVGMTAGASTPEKIVVQCVKKLQSKGFVVEEKFFMQKQLHFPLPKEIR